MPLQALCHVELALSASCLQFKKEAVGFWLQTPHLYQHGFLFPWNHKPKYSFFYKLPWSWWFNCGNRKVTNTSTFDHQSLSCMKLAPDFQKRITKSFGNGESGPPDGYVFLVLLSGHSSLVTTPSINEILKIYSSPRINVTVSISLLIRWFHSPNLDYHVCFWLWSGFQCRSANRTPIVYSTFLHECLKSIFATV